MDPLILRSLFLIADPKRREMDEEVLCKRCGAHLGHVFDDGPEEKGGKSYCFNSICLELDREEK